VIQYGVHFDSPEGDDSRRKPRVQSTGRGSNPSPSSAESNANLTFRSPSYVAPAPKRGKIALADADRWNGALPQTLLEGTGGMPLIGLPRPDTAGTTK
jgi:hypothetical protein